MYQQVSGGSNIPLTTLSQSSSAILVQFQEFCSLSSTYCPDGTNISVILSQGFSNAWSTLTTYSQYISANIVDPTTQY